MVKYLIVGVGNVPKCCDTTETIISIERVISSLIAAGFTGCAESQNLVAADFSLRIENAILNPFCATYPQDPHGKVAATKRLRTPIQFVYFGTTRVAYHCS